MKRAKFNLENLDELPEKKSTNHKRDNKKSLFEMIIKIVLLVVVFLAAIVLVQSRLHQSFISDQTKTYIVTKITDGDTINVNDENGNKLRVRFVCIDAPERSQRPWGSASTNRLKQLVSLYSKVKLIARPKTDRYGRVLAEIINEDGINVNMRLVEEGMALVYPFATKGCSMNYKQLEQTAKSKQLGVWADNAFVKPWEYRKRKREQGRARN